MSFFFRNFVRYLIVGTRGREYLCSDGRADADI